VRNLLNFLDLLSTSIARWVLTILVSFLVLFVFTGVVCRYILGWTPFFLEETSRYVLIWTGCVGASLAIKYGGFPSVDMFLNWFQPKMRNKIEMAARIILTAFLLFFLVVGIIMTIRQRDQISATLPISMIWPYMSLPFGTALILPNSLLNLCYPQRSGK
jgi:TRAP-type C4-dicarboxylate transport system permease small subunit